MVEVECATKYETKGTREGKRERDSALERLKVELILIQRSRSFYVGETARNSRVFNKLARVLR